MYYTRHQNFVPRMEQELHAKHDRGRNEYASNLVCTVQAKTPIPKPVASFQQNLEQSTRPIHYGTILTPRRYW